MGKPEGKKSLKRPRQRWEDIKMPLMVTGLECLDLICLAQNRDQWQALANMVIYLQIQ